MIILFITVLLLAPITGFSEEVKEDILDTTCTKLGEYVIARGAEYNFFEEAPWRNKYMRLTGKFTIDAILRGRVFASEHNPHGKALVMRCGEGRMTYTSWILPFYGAMKDQLKDYKWGDTIELSIRMGHAKQHMNEHTGLAVQIVPIPELNEYYLEDLIKKQKEYAESN